MENNEDVKLELKRVFLNSFRSMKLAFPQVQPSEERCNRFVRRHFLPSSKIRVKCETSVTVEKITHPLY